MFQKYTFETSTGTHSNTFQISSQPFFCSKLFADVSSRCGRNSSGSSFGYVSHPEMLRCKLWGILQDGHLLWSAIFKPRCPTFVAVECERFWVLVLLTLRRCCIFALACLFMSDVFCWLWWGLLSLSSHMPNIYPGTQKYYYLICTGLKNGIVNLWNNLKSSLSFNFFM